MLFDYDFGPRQNHLQEGPRPVVVVQTDMLNRLEGYGNVVIVPLTTKEKKSPTYVGVVPSQGNELDRDSWAITNQIFTVGKEELLRPLGRVSQTELYAIKEGLKVTLAIR